MSLRKLTFSFLAILIVTVSPLFYVSCSDTETTDSSNFALYYTGLTNIAPSMTGTISKPTYKGSAPSDFTITGITLNNEVYTGNCFLIDSETGVISVQNTENAAKGRYKISISCVSGGTRYEYKDIVIVKLLASAPKNVIVTPKLIQADYGDIINKNSEIDMPIAKITTTGEEHISISSYTVSDVFKITNENTEEEPIYELVTTEGVKECFSISQEGEFTIVQDEKSGILETGTLYAVSILLSTRTDEYLLDEKNSINIKVTSKPLNFSYDPAEGELEEESTATPEGTTFESVLPTYQGATDGLKYSIYAIEPAIEQEIIKINENTGKLYVEAGHGLQKGTTYKISVCARNMYNEEGEVGTVIENAYSLKIVAFIAKFDQFYYENETNTIERMELSPSYTIEPTIVGGGENIKYTLIECEPELQKNIEFNATTGAITMKEGNKLVINDEGKDSYTMKVKVANSKYEKEANITFKLTQNEDRITYIHCGNNLDTNGNALPGIQYENQFRFNSEDDMNRTFTIKTNAYSTAKITFKYEKLSTSVTANITNNEITFSGWKGDAATSNIGIITATVNDKTELKVPVFFHFNNWTKYNQDNVKIEYYPFVLHVNPHKGGISTSPKIILKGKSDSELSGDVRKKFLLDYRRNFNYYNFGGNHTNGVPYDQKNPDKISPFMAHLWETCGQKNNANKPPMAFFTNSGYKDNSSQSLGYVINYNPNTIEYKNHEHSVNIIKDMWKDSEGYANGFIAAEMTFCTDGIIGNVNSGGKVTPLIIWFDENYEE